MTASKYEAMADGFLRLAVVPFLAVAPVGPAAGGSVFLLLVVLFLIAVMTVGGVSRLMEALFGEGGLLCDLGRTGTLLRVKNDRAEGLRVRVTHPSAALVARGAVGRVRGVRVK
jgi:hypothetical protein